MNIFKTLPWNFNFNDIDLIKQVNKTNISLANLNFIISTLRDPQVLIEFITIKEWVKSNEIENIHTTIIDAFISEIIEERFISPENKETLNYKEAILVWLKDLKKYWWIWINTIIKINEIITWNTQGIYSSPDKKIIKWTWQNMEVIYIPPQGIDNINKLLRNFEEYYNNFNEEKEIDPLLKLPLLHYQFEAIHPFGDWNWRTGRILIVLYFVLYWKLHYPILFISDYISKNKSEYYKYLRLLDKEKEKKLKDFTLWLLKWIEQCAIETEQIVYNIKLLQEKYIKKMKEDKTLKKIFSDEMIDYLFIRPIYSIEGLSKFLNIHKNTASKYLKLLKEKWIIKEYNYKNYKFFFNDEYLQLLK